MKRNKVSLIFISFIIITLLSACGSNTNNAMNNSSNNSSSNTDAASSEVETVFEKGKYDEPIKMTVVRPLTAAILFRDGEDIDNNPHIDWAKDTFNIEMSYLWTADATSYDTRLRLSLSANEEMPDIIQCGCKPDVLNELMESGKFMAVDELFDKYANDEFKQALSETPTAWNPYRIDGKSYAIPTTDYAYNGDAVLWIRDDWMKKMNLKAPTTIAELEAMMDVFVNQDPDGNGVKDTYGLALGLKDGFTNWISDASFIFGAYGVMPEQWNLNDSGELEYGSIAPGNKEAIATIKSWLDKGYIHKEAGLHNGDKAFELFTSGKAGVIAAPYWAGGWPFPDLIANVPGSDFNAYPLPAGPEGDIGRATVTPLQNAILINKDYAHPEALILYANYLYKYQADPQPGSPLEFGFKEGYDYYMQDGQPKWDISSFPEDSPFIDVKKYTLLDNGARIPSQVMSTLDRLHNGKTPETAFEKKQYDDVFKNIQSGSVNFNQMQYAMTDYFNGASTETMKTRWDFLQKMEAEVFNKIIYGNQPLESFDSFVETWKSSSGDKITQEVNDWYKSTQ